MGLTKIYNLGYRNHMMDHSLHNELRSRLVFIFRVMKVDTVICYDPWGQYEENPDHYVTAQAVEAACWMSGGQWDLTEHFDVGLKPHSVLGEVLLRPGTAADEPRCRHQFRYGPEGRDQCRECDPGSGGAERRGSCVRVLPAKIYVFLFWATMTRRRTAST